MENCQSLVSLPVSVSAAARGPSASHKVDVEVWASRENVPLLRTILKVLSSMPHVRLIKSGFCTPAFSMALLTLIRFMACPRDVVHVLECEVMPVAVGVLGDQVDIAGAGGVD